MTKRLIILLVFCVCAIGQTINPFTGKLQVDSGNVGTAGMTACAENGAGYTGAGTKTCTHNLHLTNVNNYTVGLICRDPVAKADVTGPANYFTDSLTFAFASTPTNAKCWVANAGNFTASEIVSGLISPARLGAGTPDGTKFLRDDQVYAVPPGGGSGAYTGPCKLASSFGFAFAGDETSLLNSTIASLINGGGGCMAVDAYKTIRADGQIVTPYSVSGSLRITAACGTGPNAFTAGAPAGCGVLDLRYHGAGTNCSAGANCGPKIFTNFDGSFELDHITVTTNYGPTDCAPFLLTTVSSLYIHETTFYGGKGSYPAIGCNDGIILGGDSDVYDSAVTAPFIGYGTIIRNNKFMGLARAWTLGNASNGSVFEGNSIGGGNGTTPVDEMVLIKGNARSNRFRDNLLEFWDGAQPTAHITYNCGYKIFDGQHNYFADQFWDGNGSTRPFCTGNNLAIQNTIDKSTFVDGGSGPLTDTSWPTNNYMPYRSFPFSFSTPDGSPLTGTITKCGLMSFGGQIMQFSMSSDVSGTARITVRAGTLASYTGSGSPPADISNGGELMSGAVSLQDNTLTSWNRLFPPNSMVCFVLSSPSTVTSVSGNIQVWEGR